MMMPRSGKAEIVALDANWLKGREARIAQKAKEAGRACGNCTLCCKLVPIDTEELTKPGGEWCPHCKIGKGCGIYAERPLACRTWTCMWLTNADVAEYWYPAKCKMVLSWIPGIGTREGEVIQSPTLEIHVDPGCPNRWREEPWHSDIRRTAKLLLDERGGQTFILLGGYRRWLVLPDKEVACNGAAGMAVRMADGEWGWIECKSEEHALELQERMYEAADRIQALSAKERMQLLLEIEATGYPVPGLAEVKLELAREIAMEAPR